MPKNKKRPSRSIEKESTFSGIVSPMKDELANEHATPEGDPSIRRKNPSRDVIYPNRGQRRKGGS